MPFPDSVLSRMHLPPPFNKLLREHPLSLATPRCVGDAPRVGLSEYLAGSETAPGGEPRIWPSSPPRVLTLLQVPGPQAPAILAAVRGPAGRARGRPGTGARSRHWLTRRRADKWRYFRSGGPCPTPSGNSGGRAGPPLVTKERNTSKAGLGLQGREDLAGGPGSPRPKGTPTRDNVAA